MERFKKGFVFGGLYFDGRIEVIKVHKKKNKMEVHLTSVLTPDRWSQWYESWNLEHVIWGFKGGDYYIKEFPGYPKTQKQEMEDYIESEKEKLKEAVKPDKPWWKFW